MATLGKRGARKLVDAGKVSVGYGNMAMPMLASNKHVTLAIGSHTLRVEWQDAKAMYMALGNVLKEFD